MQTDKHKPIENRLTKEFQMVYNDSTGVPVCKLRDMVALIYKGGDRSERHIWWRHDEDSGFGWYNLIAVSTDDALLADNMVALKFTLRDPIDGRIFTVSETAVRNRKNEWVFPNLRLP